MDPMLTGGHRSVGTRVLDVSPATREPFAPTVVAAPRRPGWLLRSFVRHHGVWTLAILAFAAFNLFWRLDRTQLTDADEAHYGVAAYEMLVRHSWVRTTFGGAVDYWNLKPMLGYWTIGLSYLVAGFNRLALRLPSALSDLACIALTIALGRRVVGRAAAILAGMLLSATFPFIMQHTGRTGDLDAELALVLTATAWAAWSMRGPPRLYAVAALTKAAEHGE